jgi:hypothetical protein
MPPHPPGSFPLGLPNAFKQDADLPEEIEHPEAEVQAAGHDEEGNHRALLQNITQDVAQFSRDERQMHIRAVISELNVFLANHNEPPVELEPDAVPFVAPVDPAPIVVLNLNNPADWNDVENLDSDAEVSFEFDSVSESSAEDSPEEGEEQENAAGNISVSDYVEHVPVHDAPVAALLPGAIQAPVTTQSPPARRSPRLREANWRNLIVPSSVRLRRMTCLDEYLDRRRRPTTRANTIWLRRHEGNHGLGKSKFPAP